MKQVKYLDIRSQLQTGDLLEFGSSSFLGKAIRFFTKQDVNHSSLVLALDKWIDWSEPHKFILEAEKEGIELNLISKALQSGSKVYYSKLRSRFDDKRDLIAKYSLEQVGTPYDLKSLFLNALKKVNAEAGKFFCSEFYFFSVVAAGCLPQFKINEKGGIVDFFDNPINAPRPGEFKQYFLHEETIEIIN